MNQCTEQRLENQARLHVFKLKQMNKDKCKKQIISSFHKDIYCGLKEDQLDYINIVTAPLFEYLYDVYGDKTQELQNKAFADMEDLVDLRGPSITPFCRRQEKLLLFLLDTEQAITSGRYILICLNIIKKTNFINKEVREWCQKKFSDLIDKVNDKASRGDRSIPGRINKSTPSSTSKSSALSTAKALVTSLQARLTDTESRQYNPNHNRLGD